MADAHESDEQLQQERWTLLNQINAFTETPLVVLSFVWLGLLVIDFIQGRRETIGAWASLHTPPASASCGRGWDRPDTARIARCTSAMCPPHQLTGLPQSLWDAVR